MFVETLFTAPEYFLWWILIAVFSVCLHELFHALAAYYEGDDTAKRLGYFTLNPLVHMGTQSLVILLLTGMCWGACPVNPSRFRHRYGEALVAFAGPFANLLLMFLFALAGIAVAFCGSLNLIPETPANNLERFLSMASRANAAFFLLNMLPVPPLDGHGIAVSLFPSLRPFYARLGQAGFALIILLFWLPVGFSRFFWQLSAQMSLACYALLIQALR
ncbi:MAG TPA: site-2 protease family protein [Oculatellaceae cyanobacterium]|jgi:Zn-dependent protease